MDSHDETFLAFTVPILNTQSFSLIIEIQSGLFPIFCLWIKQSCVLHCADLWTGEGEKLTINFFPFLFWAYFIQETWAQCQKKSTQADEEYQLPSAGERKGEFYLFYTIILYHSPFHFITPPRSDKWANEDKPLMLVEEDTEGQRAAWSVSFPIPLWESHPWDSVETEFCRNDALEVDGYSVSLCFRASLCIYCLRKQLPCIRM